MKARQDHLIDAPDDGLPADQVGAWAERKYRVLRAYAEMFSTGMKNAWETRVYLDLFAGSGHALLGDARRRVLTSPLIALGVRDAFTKYVFCELESTKLKALETRIQTIGPRSPVKCLQGDSNACVNEIADEIPVNSPSKRVLSLCFIDPYNLGIEFDTIRTLGEHRALDVIIVLMIHMDAGRNGRSM